MKVTAVLSALALLSPSASSSPVPDGGTAALNATSDGVYKGPWYLFCTNAALSYHCASLAGGSYKCNQQTGKPTAKSKNDDCTQACRCVAQCVLDELVGGGTIICNLTPLSGPSKSDLSEDSKAVDTADKGS